MVILGVPLVAPPCTTCAACWDFQPSQAYIKVYGGAAHVEKQQQGASEPRQHVVCSGGAISVAEATLRTPTVGGHRREPTGLSLLFSINHVVSQVWFEFGEILSCRSRGPWLWRQRSFSQTVFAPIFSPTGSGNGTRRPIRGHIRNLCYCDLDIQICM